MKVLLIAVFIGMVTASLAAPVAWDAIQRPIPPRQEVVIGVALPSEGEPEPMVQATGAITGRVTGVGGAAIPGIIVTASDYATAVYCQEGNGAAAWPDSQGRYRIDLPAGNYLVYVNTHGFTPAVYVPEAYPDVNSWFRITDARPITVIAGQVVSNVDFTLLPGYAVTGRLVDEQGGPIPEAGGNIRDPDQEIEYGCALGFGTGSDGRFRVHVPAGLYDLGFGKGSAFYDVRRNLLITQPTNLGDVLFVEAPSIRTFDPHALLPGYALESVVPGAPNTPSDVAVTADGAIYLAAARSWQVYRVNADGTLTTAAPIGVYALDAGPDGNLYGYFMPSTADNVFRITPAGQVIAIGSVPATACESTMTVAPNLDVWIGYNDCGGTAFGESRLYRMSPSGQVTAVATGLRFGITGLDFDSRGQLYMAWEAVLYRVNATDGSRTPIATLPDGIAGASHSLVAAPDGSFYIAVQGGDEGDRILKISAAGAVSVHATLPSGCLQGLDRLPDGDLIATMRCTNALYRVAAGGVVQTLRAGNGMATPQALAFDLASQLFVNNDESGRIVRIADGRGQFFAEVVSYISPMGFLAFEPSGNFYFSEAAPGFQPRLIKVSPQGRTTVVTGSLDWPSGLAFGPAGTLYAAEHMSGEISAVSADGAVTTVVDDLIRPQALAADRTGNLYVAAYEGPFPNGTNRLWKIDAAGNRSLYATLAQSGLRDVVVGSAGELYVTGPAGRQSGIVRVTADGRTTRFATGFLSAAGLAFDVAGNLYVSDDEDNSITRITGFPRGAIAGRVTDAATGRPIPGARLSVVTSFPVVLGTQLLADAQGRYTAPAAPRPYTVTASAEGYRPESVPATVTVAMTVTVDLRLTRWPFSIYLPVVANARNASRTWLSRARPNSDDSRACCASRIGPVFRPQNRVDASVGFLQQP